MRLKIIAGNLIAVLVVGLGAYFYVKGELEKGLAAQVNEEIGNDYKLFERSWRLSALEFVDQVRDRAQSREVRLVYNAIDESGKRRAAHERANSIASWFQDPARGRIGRPDIVLLTDETGRVLARDQDLNRMANQALGQSVPSLRDVLERGAAMHDAWLKEDEAKLMQVAMAPVRNEEGGVIGAVLVGYDISNGLAAREAEILGLDVAFVEGERVYSSSFDTSVAGELQSKLFGELSSPTQGALGDSGAASNPWKAAVGGSDRVGITAPLPETPSHAIAFAVVGNQTEAMSLAEKTNVILILMVVGLLAVAIYGFIIAGSFLRPLETIEEGVLSVINGRTDHRIDIESAEFGGLAYRINQLINVFTGVEETDEEGRSAGGAGWDGAESTQGEATDAAPSGGDDDDAAAQLAAEPEAAYHQRIYDEYVAAKRAAGEDVSNFPKDRFITRLEKNGANLVKKHGCRMVRFQVQTKGSQVILRPVIIR